MPLRNIHTPYMVKQPNLYLGPVLLAWGTVTARKLFRRAVDNAPGFFFDARPISSRRDVGNPAGDGQNHSSRVS
jgi:hypothetical protein